jgi:2-isopropylmalate synthase
MVGRAQEILVGYMSGASNVTHWLAAHGIEPNEELVKAVLQRAKLAHQILTDDQIMAVVEGHRSR